MSVIIMVKPITLKGTEVTIYTAWVNIQNLLIIPQTSIYALKIVRINSTFYYKALSEWPLKSGNIFPAIWDVNV